MLCYLCTFAAVEAEASAASKRGSLSLSELAAEGSHQVASASVRLVHNCTVQLLRIISICLTRHADDMQLNAVSTYCNLLQSITRDGYLTDSGKLKEMSDDRSSWPISSADKISQQSLSSVTQKLTDSVGR